VAVFCFLIVAQGAGSLLGEANAGADPPRHDPRRQHILGIRAIWLGWATLIFAGLAVGINGAQTLDYAGHPEYTFVDAAERLTRYIDQHPNGKRLLASVSGDQIALVTHLPAINDLFDAPSPGIPDMAAKVGWYQPGWFATWNTLDLGTLEDIHGHYSLEQVASFRAFDDSKRNVLVLFKLHRWAGGRVYDPSDQNLRIRFPEDKFDIPLE
jgi:hypothetical protein